MMWFPSRISTLVLAGALVALVSGGCAPATPAAAPAPQSAAPAHPATTPAQKAAAPAKPAAAPGEMKRLILGSSSPTSSYYAFTVGFAKLVNDKIPNVQVTVSEGGGVALNARRLQQEQSDLSLAGFAGVAVVYRGLDPEWEKEPLKDARTLFIMDPGLQVYFVREDSGVKRPEDLTGKDFNPGGKGTATEFLARMVFSALDIKPRLYSGGMADAQAAMKDRRIVGMGKATNAKSPDALIQDIMASAPIRVLDWQPEHLKKAQEKYPFLKFGEIPAGVYKGAWNEKPVRSWLDGNGLYTMARLPEELAYGFTKAAVEDSKAADSVQVAAFPGMKGQDLAQLTMDLSPIPLHAGAYRYFKEIGAKIPDWLKPPEVK